MVSVALIAQWRCAYPTRKTPVEGVYLYGVHVRRIACAHTHTRQWRRSPANKACHSEKKQTLIQSFRHNKVPSTACSPKTHRIIYSQYLCSALSNPPTTAGVLHHHVNTQHKKNTRSTRAVSRRQTCTHYTHHRTSVTGIHHIARRDDVKRRRRWRQQHSTAQKRYITILYSSATISQSTFPCSIGSRTSVTFSQSRALGWYL